MKYFGTYTDNQDLVPKSYVDGFKNDIDKIEDSLNFLYSHTEYNVNVAYRVSQFKNKEIIYYDWDNYYSINDNGGSNYVELLVDNTNQLFRSTSICFNYESNDPGLPYFNEEGFPASVSAVNDNGPTDHTIYYVLGFNNHLPVGSDIYLYMRTEAPFETTTNKIRVLIPSNINALDGEGGLIQNTSNKPVYFNGRFLTTGDNTGNEKTRNGYIDLGYSFNHDYFISVTLHIYFDGEYYFIDRYAPFNSNII